MSVSVHFNLGKEPASKFILVIGRIHFLVTDYVMEGPGSLLPVDWSLYSGPRGHPKKVFCFLLPCRLPQYGYLLHHVSKENLC